MVKGPATPFNSMQLLHRRAPRPQAPAVSISPHIVTEAFAASSFEHIPPRPSALFRARESTALVTFSQPPPKLISFATGTHGARSTYEVRLALLKRHHAAFEAAKQRQLADAAERIQPSRAQRWNPNAPFGVFFRGRSPLAEHRMFSSAWLGAAPGFAV
jgi:hypothetical protein